MESFGKSVSLNGNQIDSCFVYKVQTDSYYDVKKE